MWRLPIAFLAVLAIGLGTAFTLEQARAQSSLREVLCSEDQPYFCAAFNNKILENSIYQFEHWNEIQSQEVDAAFEAYLRGHYTQKSFPKEAALIFKLIEQGGVLGVATEAHERWEVLEYLNEGYSIEDIGNGKAHKEHRPYAHDEARFKELKLYQFLYGLLFEGRVPAKRAFLYVYPLLKILDIPKADITVEAMKAFLNKEFKKQKDAVMSEKISKEDIENSIRFFEKGGFDYGNQRNLFLERGLVFLMELG